MYPLQPEEGRGTSLQCDDQIGKGVECLGRACPATDLRQADHRRESALRKFRVCDPKLPQQVAKIGQTFRIDLSQRACHGFIGTRPGAQGRILFVGENTFAKPAQTLFGVA